MTRQQPAPFRHIRRRMGYLLPAVFVILLRAGAGAVPPEPLHLPGAQDGGDFDSLIQPLVLALSGVPVEELLALTPAAPSREPAWAAIPAALPVPAARLPQPRAPPLD